MERVVNLRPAVSRHTLVRCCSPSASERREYEAPSVSSCTGNEMWNEMSRYDVFSSSFVQNRSEDRLLQRLFSPRCLASLSFIISAWTSCVRRENCLCLFTIFFRLHTWCNILLCCHILPYYAAVSYSAFSVLLSSGTYYITMSGLMLICLSSFSSQTLSLVSSP